ncbi:helix-turn-helix domain-containing protein [Deinococcus humi]|uniref:Zn-dependent peptidase ImmA (M78 family)/DNA-binding XRE family transcriptional regulator n=1 Tax=Deinococcus humi TaxID=662880 RepID=A0A7W8JSE4_9DEIO|nr:Zn-dependent peptidase ImmA (M78 family)/DNA-binding XRE family transcriptional regulator [Deinococcus humi]GGO22319.1 transcriptional regulator [Deinococcus humi]
MKQPSSFVGARLSEVREAYGMAVGTLATLVGVHRNTIGEYENGAQPDGPTLDRISKVLGVPAHYFFVPIVREAHAPPLFRCKSKTTETEKRQAEVHLEWVQEIDQFISKHVALPKPNLPDLSDIPAHPRLIRSEHIEEVAVRVRNQWGLGEAPLNNVVHVLEKNGYIVSHFSLGFDNVEALFFKTHRERAYILVNKDYDSAARLRFTALHEASHDILHGRLPTNFEIDKPMKKLIEQQGNELTLAIALPQAFIDEVKSVSLETLRILKPRWKMSIQAMLRRLLNVGRIDKARFASLMVHLSKRGWRMTEPHDDALPIERPTLLKSAINALVTKAGMQKSALGAVLPLPVGIVEKLAGLPAGYFVPDPEDFNLSVPKNIQLFG